MFPSTIQLLEVIVDFRKVFLQSKCKQFCCFVTIDLAIIEAEWKQN